MTTTHGIGLRYGLLTSALLLMIGTDAAAGFITLTASLNGAQETPPNSSPGTGSAAFILDDVNNRLITAASFSALAGTTTSADIEDGTGLIIHPFSTGPAGFPTGVTQGFFTDIWTGLTPTNVAALESGSYWINIRTSAFPGGEIRGQITSSAVPEPASLVLGASAAVVLLGGAWLRRR